MDLDNYAKDSVIRLMTLLFDHRDPKNTELFELQQLTCADIYNIVKEQLPKIDEVFTVRQVAIMLNNNRDHFGNLICARDDHRDTKMRSLYVLIIYHYA